MDTHQPVVAAKHPRVCLPTRGRHYVTVRLWGTTHPQRKKAGQCIRQIPSQAGALRRRRSSAIDESPETECVLTRPKHGQTIFRKETAGVLGREPWILHLGGGFCSPSMPLLTVKGSSGLLGLVLGRPHSGRSAIGVDLVSSYLSLRGKCGPNAKQGRVTNPRPSQPGAGPPPARSSLN